jgi:hypothetical protein
VIGTISLEGAETQRGKMQKEMNLELKKNQ